MLIPRSACVPSAASHTRLAGGDLDPPRTSVGGDHGVFDVDSEINVRAICPRHERRGHVKNAQPDMALHLEAESPRTSSARSTDHSRFDAACVTAAHCDVEPMPLPPEPLQASVRWNPA